MKQYFYENTNPDKTTAEDSAIEIEKPKKIEKLLSKNNYHTLSRKWSIDRQNALNRPSDVVTRLKNE